MLLGILYARPVQLDSSHFHLPEDSPSMRKRRIDFPWAMLRNVFDTSKELPRNQMNNEKTKGYVLDTEVEKDGLQDIMLAGIFWMSHRITESSIIGFDGFAVIRS